MPSIRSLFFNRTTEKLGLTALSVVAISTLSLTIASGWQQQGNGQGQGGGQDGGQGRGQGRGGQGGQGGGQGRGSQGGGQGRGGQGGQGRGQGRGNPPPPEYHTDFPVSALNVIAGAPTQNAIHLSVLSKSSQKLTLTYKLKDSSEATKSVSIEAVGEEPKDVEISTLKPGSTYTYSLLSANDPSVKVEGTFCTAKAPGKRFVFEIQADSHLDGNTGTDVYENTLKNMVADKPDFLVDLGDTFMVDKYRIYKDALKQYQAQRYWFSIPGSQMSVFLCLGNHDGETGWPDRSGEDIGEWSRTQRKKYFPVVKPNSFYTGAPEKGLYYAWAWGDAQFIVLDPFMATTRRPGNDTDGWRWTLGKEQYQWLETTLKQSKSKYKFVFLHHLVGGLSREARGGSEAAGNFEWGDEKEFPTQRPGWSAPIHTLLRKYKVTGVFHGHDHLYVRQEKDHILYQEVPQPGYNHGENTRTAQEYGYTTGKLLGSPGHIRVTVDPKEVKMEYVKSRLAGNNREVLDSCIMNASGVMEDPARTKVTSTQR